MKCDVIDGSIVIALRQPVLFSFVFDKPHRFKGLCQLETIQIKKSKKSVLNTITFYLENDKNEEVDFNGATLHLVYN